MSMHRGIHHHGLRVNKSEVLWTLLECVLPHSVEGLPFVKLPGLGSIVPDVRRRAQDSQFEV